MVRKFEKIVTSDWLKPRIVEIDFHKGSAYGSQFLLAADLGPL